MFVQLRLALKRRQALIMLDDRVPVTRWLVSQRSSPVQALACSDPRPPCYRFRKSPESFDLSHRSICTVNSPKGRATLPGRSTVQCGFIATSRRGLRLSRILLLSNPNRLPMNYWRPGLNTSSHLSASPAACRLPPAACRLPPTNGAFCEPA